MLTISGTKFLNIDTGSNESHCGFYYVPSGKTAIITDAYCYPRLDTRLGSKKCNEGWKEIPEEIILKRIEIIHKRRIESCGPRGTDCKPIY